MSEEGREEKKIVERSHDCRARVMIMGNRVALSKQLETGARASPRAVRLLRFHMQVQVHAITIAGISPSAGSECRPRHSLRAVVCGTRNKCTAKHAT